MIQPIMHRAIGSVPAPTGTEYSGFPTQISGGGGSEFQNKTPWTTPGTFRSVTIGLDIPPGAGKSWTINIRKNGSTQVAQIVIADAETEGTDSTDFTANGTTDYFTMEWVPSGTPAGMGGAWLFTEFEATASAESGYASWMTSSATLPRSQGTLWAAQVSVNAWATNAGSDLACIIPTDGTLTKHRAKASLNLGGGESIAFHIWHAPSGSSTFTKQDGSGATVNTGMTMAAGTQDASASFSLPVSAGDRVYTEAVGTGGPANIRLALACTFVADTDNESIIGGWSSAGPLTTGGGVSYRHTDAYGNWTQPEAVAQRLYVKRGLELGRLYVSAVSAPGTAKTIIIDVRKNAATPTGTLSVTLTGTTAPATGNDLTNGVSLAVDDSFHMRATTSGSPTVSATTWSMVVSATTPIVGSFVRGVTTTVKANRSAAFGLDGNTNVLSDEGKLKVFGNFEVTGTTTLANNSISNAELEDMAQSTIKGRAAGAGTGDPTDLTATQATAILNNLVGDSGSGGTKGLAPAPAAGDAAAEKFLRADATWAIPPGGGSPGGGGGDSTYTAVQGSRPAAANNGDLFFPSDGFVVQRDTGAAWVSWGPLFPLTAPIDGDFAWVNQGGASVTADAASIFLRATATAGVSWRIRKKAAPSTPYTITLGFLHTSIAGSQMGLLFRQSSDGKLHGFSVHNEASNGRIYSFKNTDATTFSASYTGSPQANWFIGGIIFLRIADNGTDRICSYSGDGQNWIVFHSIGRTDFLTADEVGFYVNSGSATYEAGMTVLSWKQG